MRTRAPILATALALASTVLIVPVRSQAPERRLALRPLARAPEPFSDITGVRELSDGRAIVLDDREQRLVIVDMATGVVRPVGRSGQGPGEYRRATRLVALPGDTTWVTDAETRRVLVVGPDGSTLGVITGFGQAATDSGLTAVSLRGADAAGRLYFTGRGARVTPSRVEPADSVPVYRFDRATNVVQFVATVAQPGARITMTMAGKEIRSVNVVRPPFAVGDEWVLAPEGLLAVARREPYRLDIASSGRPIVRGPEVPVTALPVTAADKAEYLAALPNGASVDPNTLAWPEAKPPFLPRAVVSAARGETWVRQTARPGTPIARYDVFDAAGRLVSAVVVPSTHRILLVTTRGTYVARSDDDGLQYIERYPTPM